MGIRGGIIASFALLMFLGRKFARLRVWLARRKAIGGSVLTIFAAALLRLAATFALVLRFRLPLRPTSEAENGMILGMSL